MTSRFRIIAGPNGSGKTTLTEWLQRDYAVNFYHRLNADDIFAEVKVSHATRAPLPVENAHLVRYAEASGYQPETIQCFTGGTIHAEGDIIRFASDDDINSYTVALVTNFLQAELIAAGLSFSQETVFSHVSKVDALAAAKAVGFRTYLYFVATEKPSVNLARVASRYAAGGHDVPPEKVMSRYARSLANVRRALPYVSRAYFFDNGGTDMRYLASWSAEDGFALHCATDVLPKWFLNSVYNPLNEELT